MIKNVFYYMIDRLQEKSTWLGLAAVATAIAGPAAGLLISKLGAVVIGILGMGLVTLPTHQLKA